MKIFLSILLASCSFYVFTQNEYHVFPENHITNPGKPFGDGSLSNPWDLQTALNQSSEIINGGDTLWLHNGIYNGRFTSKLKSTIAKKNIIVASFTNEKAILNGNVKSKQKTVLEVLSNGVTFKNFEITFLGDFNRDVSKGKVDIVAGVNHLRGECKFLNLKINNVTGIGFGSWKSTEGSVIKDCLIFNNGYLGKSRGHGVGIYVQNKSDKIRLIEGNIIFNNYYKGIEVWDAVPNPSFDYVKNVSVINNVVFNNGLPSGVHRGNIIVGTDSNNGINFAENILVKNNILYHNTDFLNDKNNFGNGESLTLGYNYKAPIRNVKVFDNIIIGKNNAFTLINAENLKLKRNTIYCGYMHFAKAVLKSIKTKDLDFSDNLYFSRRSNAFRILKHQDFNIEEWKNQFNIDSKSKRSHIQNFNLDKKLLVSQHGDNYNIFKTVVFNKEGKQVSLDFSEYKVPQNATYKIKNIEDNSVIAVGKLNDSNQVVFPMGNYNSTAKNFGVYFIEFETGKVETKKGFIKRLFEYLGF